MRLLFPYLLASALVTAAPLKITLTPPPPAEIYGFRLGDPRAPDGSMVTVDSRSLRLNGQPWTPAMGEFHYARYPAAEWREELLKMKAGGIDIVATYVFWIHHEESEGEWDWTGSRDLRRFVATAHEVGLKVIVRCGPWCHGEVRNGGLPDWIVARGNVRSDDPGYLDHVRELYGQIAAQLSGQLWKNGGPVIGIQLENEYGGPAEHLLTLKKLARAAGLDVPLYTRTGWPALKTALPFGEILPLYGVYAEGFWDRELSPMPGNYWAGFHFSTLRTDANIANEALGRTDAKDAPDIARYPYLTCEIGGGMMSSYHRRILIDPRDVEATTLVKLGSGSTSPGYYMYHGGTNPDGRLTTLMENQATAVTNWNDLPVKNYDFQAPLGQYGQIRPQYHALRRLHYFLRECGADLAETSVALPAQRPAGRDDYTTLRWSVRSNGQRGFVFINNYERLQALPAKRGVQFDLTLADGSRLLFPAQPVTIAPDTDCIWPFHLDLGGVTLAYATAQPLSHIVDDNGIRTVFFAETPGVPAEFAFDVSDAEIDAPVGSVTQANGRVLARNVGTGRSAAIRLKTRSGTRLQIVVLGEADSLAFWKGPWLGRNRAFLTDSGLVWDDNTLRLTATQPGAISVAIFPTPPRFTVGGRDVVSESDGIFSKYEFASVGRSTQPVAFTLVRPAGPTRVISLGQAKEPVAAAPTDADFAEAATWRIELPAKLDMTTDPLLRITYVGDVARVMAGGKLLTDDFYNGRALEVGLRRFATELSGGELTIEILPLQADAPIYFSSADARSALGHERAVARIDRIELISRPTVSAVSATPAK